MEFREVFECIVSLDFVAAGGLKLVTAGNVVTLRTADAHHSGRILRTTATTSTSQLQTPMAMKNQMMAFGCSM